MVAPILRLHAKVATVVPGKIVTLQQRLAAAIALYATGACVLKYAPPSMLDGMNVLTESHLHAFVLQRDSGNKDSDDEVPGRTVGAACCPHSFANTRLLTDCTSVCLPCTHCGVSELALAFQRLGAELANHTHQLEARTTAVQCTEHAAAGLFDTSNRYGTLMSP